MTTIGWHPNELSGLRHEINQLFDHILEGKEKTAWSQDNKMLLDLRLQLNLLFDHVWEAQEKGEWIQGKWSPAVDIAETKDEIVVTAELPGVREKEVKVHIRKGVLTIQGEKKKRKKDRERQFHQTERPYGSFSRSIRLPVKVASGKADTACKDGVLTVKQRKAKSARSRPTPEKGE